MVSKEPEVSEVEKKRRGEGTEQRIDVLRDRGMGD